MSEREDINIIKGAVIGIVGGLIGIFIVNLYFRYVDNPTLANSMLVISYTIIFLLMIAFLWNLTENKGKKK